MPEPRILRAGFLGRVPYAGAAALQVRLRDALAAGEGHEHLLLLEHPSVFTLGRNADSADVVADAAWLDQRGVAVHEADRGGQATYHGPGQLVGYPIVDLKPDRRDVRRYVRDLEEVLIRTLADFGVAGEPALSPRAVGVWVGERKIASLGVHLRHWLTTHGFALNVTTDLSFFGGIVACGMASAPMTSIEQLTAEAPAVEAVARRVTAHFAAVFERRVTALDTEEIASLVAAAEEAEASTATGPASIAPGASPVPPPARRGGGS